MNRVDVWIVDDLGSWAIEDSPWRKVLSGDELARAARFAHEPSRRMFVATRMALRTIVGRLSGTPPADLSFGTNELGRPLVERAPGMPTYHLSVAHTDGCCLVAVSSEGEIGIDIEPTHRQVEWALAERVCTMEEQAVLAGVAGDTWARTFLQYWVRKEAVVKADGRGFRIAPGTIDVRSPGPVAVAGAREPIHVDDLDVGPAHIAAIAGRGTPPAVTRHRWDGSLAGGASDTTR